MVNVYVEKNIFYVALKELITVSTFRDYYSEKYLPFFSRYFRMIRRLEFSAFIICITPQITYDSCIVAKLCRVILLECKLENLKLGNMSVFFFHF